MNTRTLDQLKKQHITNRQPQRGLDGSNKLVKSFAQQVGLMGVCLMIKSYN